jgi:D-amino-acid dehydrogenase
VSRSTISNSPSVTVIGGGITGITTAYYLLQRGFRVNVIDRQPDTAMETSYANGGQLSASNAEVWNSWSTLWKGAKWILNSRAPLLLNLSPSFHKYSWLAEFVAGIRNHRANTLTTVRLAIAARRHLFEIAEREQIEFDLEKRGILHLYHDERSFRAAARGNALLQEGGLERREVSDEEIHSLEPALIPRFYGGFYTASDSTGDIRKFTRGLAAACDRAGAQFHFNHSVRDIRHTQAGIALRLSHAMTGRELPTLQTDAVVICAGVGSRQLAAQLGDRINIYPVKGYSITVHLDDARSQSAAPWISLLDEAAKIVTSRLGTDRFRVAGTAEFNGLNKDIRADRIEPLVDWCQTLFPTMSVATVTPWAGLRPMTPSMMPRVGRGSRPRVFYNTGHGHLGWTLSAATAAMITDTIVEDVVPSARLKPAVRS